MSKKINKLVLLTPLLTLIFTQPSFACLSCGCGTSSSSSDLSSVGGASSIFSKDKSFLLQIGSSYKNINGSFNELSLWNKKPVDSDLTSIQNTFSLMYFPIKDFSISIQTPMLMNFFSKATFGTFGSINPTDLDFVQGISFGDTSTQLTYKAYESNNFAIVPWLKLDIPTGQSTGKPENISGSGVFKLNSGILSIKTLDKFEFILNLGYQHPLSANSNSNNTFYAGNAFMGQFNVNYQLTDKIKIGLGTNGFIGTWLYGKDSTITSKIKLTSSIQYDLSMFNGIGISSGYDPNFLGMNSSTDANLNLVFYQFY